MLLAAAAVAEGLNPQSASDSGPDFLPLIDAHSQVDCNVSEETVLRQLQRLQISRVLISIRGCKGWSSEQLEARTLKWAGNHPDRISALLSTKVDGWSYASLDSGSINAFEWRSNRNGFVGMGEVLVQHAAHNHAQLTYPQLSLRLDDRRIRKAIDVARVRSWPVILHVELNDNEEQSAQTLQDLHELLAEYSDTQFGLIHMGQASAQEARSLLQQHRNLFFLTTTADDFAAQSMQKSREKGKVSQTGWINLFQGNCALRECPSGWKPEWKQLVMEYPDRFVLAFENVFPNHWEEPYALKVGIWRRALAKLPVQVAHGNAERLWKLPPARLPNGRESSLPE